MHYFWLNCLSLINWLNLLVIWDILVSLPNIKMRKSLIFQWVRRAVREGELGGRTNHEYRNIESYKKWGLCPILAIEYWKCWCIRDSGPPRSQIKGGKIISGRLAWLPLSYHSAMPGIHCTKFYTTCTSITIPSRPKNAISWNTLWLHS